MDWEKVASNPETLKLIVPGGWIIFIQPSHREPCAVFVPYSDVTPSE